MEAAFVAAGREAWPHILGPEQLDTLKLPARWIELIGNPDQGRILVLRDDAGVAGFSVSLPTDDKATEIDGFYTHPRIWGQGYGRRLMDATMDACPEATTFRLWTATENHRPRRFYEAYGFALTCESRVRSLGPSTFEELRYQFARTGQ